MPMLTDNSRDDFRTLLAHDVLDASKGALLAHEAKLQPDDVNRTILIGIGGTGVRTIDYVKGAISKRLDASWKGYAYSPVPLSHGTAANPHRKCGC